MYYELQPLRIQAGWKVEYNNFSEYDIDEHGESEKVAWNRGRKSSLFFRLFCQVTCILIHCPPPVR